jgi:hypothetical protein
MSKPNVKLAHRMDAEDAESTGGHVRRYDFDGEPLRVFERDTDGVMLVQGVPVREGILKYRQADGSVRRELVTLDAVLDTARTIARSAVVLDHPDGFVNPDNYQTYGVGDVDGNPVIRGVIKKSDGTYESDYENAQGGFVEVKLAVRRRDALDAIKEDGRRELSPGYGALLDETPGVHHFFGQYDARQIGRNVNHLAIPERGRGGASVSLRVDSADAIQVGRVQPSKAHTDKREDRHMIPKLVTLLTLLGVSKFDNEDLALDEGAERVKALQADAAKYDAKSATAVAGQLKKAQDRITKLEADLEAAKGKVDAFTKELDQFRKADAEREDAETLAGLQDVADTLGVQHDGLDLAQLRLALVKTKVDSVDEEATAEYLDAILDVVRSDAASKTKRAGSRWDFKSTQKDNRADGGDREDAEFFSPYYDHADKTREASAGSAGGGQ